MRITQVSRYFRFTNRGLLPCSLTLNIFIVEPFLPHASNTEYYVCITSTHDGDNILFTHEGGVNIGDADAKGLVFNIPVTEPFPSREKIADTLLKHVPAEKKETLVDFVIRPYSVYVDLHFAYLEINPSWLSLTPPMVASLKYAILIWQPNWIRRPKAYAGQSGQSPVILRFTNISRQARVASVQTVVHQW